MRIREIPEDFALVLQQVDEMGEEDLTTLAESLRFDNARLSHIISSLRNKGLVRVSHTTQDTWISLSTRGRKLIELLWPESHLQYSY